MRPISRAPTPLAAPLRAAAPVETRYAWYVVGVLTLANVSGFLDRQVLSLLVPAIERDLRISDTQMSLLQGLAFALFYVVVGLPFGRLVDRTNRRNVIVVGETQEEAEAHARLWAAQNQRSQ